MRVPSVISAKKLRYKNIYGIILPKRKTEGESKPRYKVQLSKEEREEVQKLVQKGGKWYRNRDAQIIQKVDEIAENAEWTNERIKGAYGAANATTAGVAKRFVFGGANEHWAERSRKNIIGK
jgi:hypothetical protein